MASIKIILRKDKPRPDGTCPLYLRIIHNRVKRYKKLDLFVKPGCWNGEKVKRSCEEAARINRDIHFYKTKANQAIHDIRQAGQKVTAQRIKNYIGGASDKLLVGFIEGLSETMAYWQEKKFKTLRNKIQGFRPKTHLSEVTPDWLKRFEKYLKESHDNAKNTRSKELQRLRRSLNAAMKEGLITYEDNPFAMKQYEIAWEKTSVAALTAEELAAFAGSHYPEDHPYTLYQKTFLFCVYADGMRIGDCISLRSDQVSGGVLEYEMMKTGKHKRIKLPKKAVEIVDWLPEGKWLFPYLSERKKYDEVSIREDIKTATAKINKGLKKVAGRAGIDKNISTHVARHTFAWLADDKGWSITEIQEGTGHSNIQQVRDYIGRIRTDRLTDKRDELFD